MRYRSVAKEFEVRLPFELIFGFARPAHDAVHFPEIYDPNLPALNRSGGIRFADLPGVSGRRRSSPAGGEQYADEDEGTGFHLHSRAGASLIIIPPPGNEDSVLLEQEEVKRLTEQKATLTGPDLHVYGSANLLQTLLKHDLVDAFWLKIYPLTLGSGKRLFADGTIPAAFKVTEAQVSPNGIFNCELRACRRG